MPEGIAIDDGPSAVDGITALGCGAFGACVGVVGVVGVETRGVSTNGTVSDNGSCAVDGISGDCIGDCVDVIVDETGGGLVGIDDDTAGAAIEDVGIVVVPIAGGDMCMC